MELTRRRIIGTAIGLILIAAGTPVVGPGSDLTATQTPTPTPTQTPSPTPTPTDEENGEPSVVVEVLSYLLREVGAIVGVASIYLSWRRDPASQESVDKLNDKIDQLEGRLRER